MSSIVAAAFQELFYGAGIWLGILLILAIVSALSLRSRFAGLLCIPVCVFMGISYLAEGTGNQLWGAIIMFVASGFLTLQLRDS